MDANVREEINKKLRERLDYATQEYRRLRDAGSENTWYTGYSVGQKDALRMVRDWLDELAPDPVLVVREARRSPCEPQGEE